MANDKSKKVYETKKARNKRYLDEAEYNLEASKKSKATTKEGKAEKKARADHAKKQKDYFEKVNGPGYKKGGKIKKPKK